MEQQIKDNIKEALKAYRKDNVLSQDDIASKAGVNVSYINAIENGNTHIGKTAIKDSYYKKVAKAINYQYERLFWRHVDTPQYLQLYAELMDAKVSGRVRVLIGKTRHGKTYTVDRFTKKVPKDTYRITVSSLYRLKDIVNELCELLNLDTTGSYVARLKRISKTLNDKKMKGSKPDIIIDEAENMTIPVLRMSKALYDAVKDSCSLTFVGTPQFKKKLEALRDKDIEGMPQFYCRLKAGIREIKDIDNQNDFDPFFELVEDEGLKVLLTNLADNYGELNDYLEYALQEANRMGVHLTEKLFKNLFNL